MHDRLQRLPEPRPAGIGERIVLALVRHRLFTPQNLPDDLHVFARSCERLGERLSVPSLHDLWTAHAQPQQQTPARQVIQRHRVHRRRHRCARADLHDAGAELDRLRVRADPCERCEDVAAVGFGGPDRVVAESFGRLCKLDRVVGRLRPPVAERQAEPQIRRHRPYPPGSETTFVSRNSSNPCTPPSRPWPLCL